MEIILQPVSYRVDHFKIAARYLDRSGYDLTSKPGNYYQIIFSDDGYFWSLAVVQVPDDELLITDGYLCDSTKDYANVLDFIMVTVFNAQNN